MNHADCELQSQQLTGYDQANQCQGQVSSLPWCIRSWCIRSCCFTGTPATNAPSYRPRTPGKPISRPGSSNSCVHNELYCVGTPSHKPIARANTPNRKCGNQGDRDSETSRLSAFLHLCVVLGKWREELLLRSTSAEDSALAEQYIRERAMLPPLVCSIGAKVMEDFVLIALWYSWMSASTIWS